MIRLGLVSVLLLMMLAGCGTAQAEYTEAAETEIQETEIQETQMQTETPAETTVETEPPITEITLGSHTIGLDAHVLSFEDENISAAELAEGFAQMPELVWVEVRNCGIPQKEMIDLIHQFPKIEFYWDVDVFGQMIPSDAVEIDISKTPVEDVSEVEALAELFPYLKKVIMVGCNVDNDVMDELNLRHEDVQYVWDVKICWRKIRTDITWFFPFKLDVEPMGDDLYNLRYCHDVICVDLGHAQIKDIEFARYMPKLKYMLFGDTRVADISPLEDHKELIYLELFKTKVTDYTPLLSCTALEDLNLGYTYGDAEVIRQMTWLKHLWWHRPCPPWGGPETETRLHLADYLPDTVVDVRYTNGSTDGGWRMLPNYYAQRDYLGMFYMEG